MGDANTVLCSTSSPAPPRSRAADRGVEFFCQEAAAAPRRRHSLDACSLCCRPLGRSRDIYMYRGDTPFCSEDCRQEQIDLDLARGEDGAGHRRRSRRAHASLSSGPASAAAVQAAEALMAS